ncbi:protein kinase [Rhodococcus sp. IEGM 1351]|uniref:protein kinase domain-containing protein n=1 Tax=Rhodococcus sp. IEGM 1351 TaxID=3047089 RepID=UPI0024B6AF38|nr:protein kinase [Rhodococcus sp. IEGM 1351]MDI9939206.1 protein kinase [Rhodococcus sp. IEGM 1351]
MTDVDPFATQRDVSGSVTAELAAAGFEDAQEIGRGGFGVVYRCTQAALDRTVAVKVLTADLDEENRARFLREQRAAGRLTGHPNIVNVLHADVTENGRPFIVMPYHAQGSLDERIRRHGPLPLDEALRLGVKMAGALETAHRLGILHRDVKPGNILITEYGEPALTDFGIAHIAGGFETTAGVVTGSPAFTAPEVVAGEPPSPAADVYGLGATLFAALTGHAAFERRSGEQLVAQFLRITSEPVPNPREHGISEGVSAVIERAMSTEAGARPSAVDLGRQLRRSQLHQGFPVDEMAMHTEPAAVQGGTSVIGARSAAEGESAVRSPSWSPADSGRTGGLPLELTSFVDRRTELAEGTNLLSTSRLVTLTGVGGVGKTRLALRVATKVHRDFVDGVTLVDLGDLRDESLLAGVVAGALGLRDRSARPLNEVLVEFLAPLRLLLVLDTCEQVVGAVAKLAESLLRVCPRLRILATSREPVGIGGESVLVVPPLPVPDPDHLPKGLPRNDAVTLFADRGAAAVPGFELTEDNKVTIARICQRLDGLPLPIELAAARLRAMTPDQILQRLTDRYLLLTRGSRDAPSRQQTLRMCIDWSYDLCTPVEQRMWAQLSVFAGSFELEAAEQVCDLTAEDLLDTVTFLVDKSILTREESGSAVRFRMLETVRAYGREKAQETGDYSELRRRHRDWCERLAVEAESEWIGSRQLALIAKLGREQPNFRDALEFCLSDSADSGLRIAAALYPFWLSQGLFSEGRRWLDRLLAHRTGQSPVDRAKALYAATVLAGVQADLRASAVLVEEGRALATQTIDPMLHAHIDLAAGFLALFEGSPSDARTYLENALHVYTSHKDLLFQVVAVGILGVTHETLNDTERAIECYERVLAITEANGESVYRSYSLWALGVAVWRHGEHARAVQLLVQALQVDRMVNDRLNGSMCLQALAWIAAEEQNFERATVLTAAAEGISRSLGSPTVFFPGLLVYQDECERRTREAMGEQAFTAARRRGTVLGFDAAVAYALGEQIPRPPTPAAGLSGKLTKREREVADLIAEGLTNKEIAARLVISPRTAQGHVEHLLAKLGFTSRAQIAVWVAGLQIDS